MWAARFMTETSKRNFFPWGFLDCICDAPLQCSIFSPLPLKTRDPTWFLCPGNQNTTELSTIIFVQYMSKSLQLGPKDPIQCSPWKRGNHAGFPSYTVFQPPSVVQLTKNKLWITSSYTLLIRFCIILQPLLEEVFWGWFPAAPWHIAEVQLPILMALDWFQCQNLSTDKICVLWYLLMHVLLWGCLKWTPFILMELH